MISLSVFYWYEVNAFKVRLHRLTLENNRTAKCRQVINKNLCFQTAYEMPRVEWNDNRRTQHKKDTSSLLRGSGDLPDSSCLNNEKGNQTSSVKKTLWNQPGWYFLSKAHILRHFVIMCVEKLGILKIGTVMALSGLRRFQSTYNIGYCFFPIIFSLNPTSFFLKLPLHALLFLKK